MTQQRIKRLSGCCLLLMTAYSFTAANAALTNPTVSNDQNNIIFSYKETTAFPYNQVYIDTDLSPKTGYPINGIGAERLLENGTLYKQNGGVGWNWLKLQNVTYTSSGGLYTWTVPLSTLGVPLVCNTPVNVIFRAGSNSTSDISLVNNYKLILGTTCGTGNGSGTGIISNPSSSATTTQFTFSYQAKVIQTAYRVLLDTDGNASTGYPLGGLGADFLLEGNGLFSYVGPGWNWLQVATVTFSASAKNVVTWTINRSGINVNGAMDCLGGLNYLYQVENIGVLSSTAKTTVQYPNNPSCNVPTPPPPPPSTGSIPIGITWNYVLSATPDLSIKAGAYDIDGFDNTAAMVASIHAIGSKAICYIDAGTYENWRPDIAQFPASVRGSNNGWPGEQWLDIRQIAILGPIMQARLDMCKSKGFDAVEFDNIDGYSNSTGFPLTALDQINYNTYLATQAHSRGLAAALKNDVDQVKDLISVFDFAINEQCFQYGECNTLTPFITANKAVLNVEYQGSTSSFCPQANAMKFSSIFKNIDLPNPVTSCN